MNTTLFAVAGFYVGGGLALALLWCGAGLTWFDTPDSPLARRANTAMRVVGYVHPLAALMAQDLDRIRTGIEQPPAPGEDPTTSIRLRLDPALGLSTVLLAGTGMAAVL